MSDEIEKEYSKEGLRDLFKKYSSISSLEWLKIIPHLRFKRFKKGELFFRQGEVTNRCGFLLYGLFKVSHINEESKEKILDFRYKGQPLASISSYLFKTPSLFSGEAMSKSLVVYVDYDVLVRLAEDSVQWERLIRKGTEESMARKERREFELLCLSPEERYERFASEFKNIINDMPQYSVANYLGINPVSLSRIRARRV